MVRRIDAGIVAARPTSELFEHLQRGILRLSSADCGAARMIALNEKLHHNGTTTRNNLRHAGRSVPFEKSVDIPISVLSETSMATQHPPRSSAASLCKSVNPCGPIFCGYPDKNHVSREIGTGLNDSETQLYYVRNRTYSPVLGTVLGQELKSRKALRGTVREIQRYPIGYPDETQSVDNESGQDRRLRCCSREP